MRTDSGRRKTAPGSVRKIIRIPRRGRVWKPPGAGKESRRAIIGRAVAAAEETPRGGEDGCRGFRPAFACVRSHRSCAYAHSAAENLDTATQKLLPQRIRLTRGRVKSSPSRPRQPLGLCGRGWKRLKFLARLEAHGLAWRDVHLLAGARVPPDAGLARLHVEHAEAAQFDAASAAERVLHGLENGLNRLLGLRAGNIRFLNDSVYDVELDHECLRE